MMRFNFDDGRGVSRRPAFLPNGASYHEFLCDAIASIFILKIWVSDMMLYERDSARPYEMIFIFLMHSIRRFCI